jgi:DNA-binding GntR family transcriptional regulator
LAGPGDDHNGSGGHLDFQAKYGMTGSPVEWDGRGLARDRAQSTGVLADRIAAALLHHEPGWRLPRHTALARRYNVSAAEVEVAIDELTERNLLRRLPDGQVYRASPAEYRLAIEGMAGLTSHVDPMGGELAAKTRHVSKRRPPEDIGRVLGVTPGDIVLVIRCLWTVGGEPAAFSSTYLPEHLAGLLPEFAAAPSPSEGPVRAGYARALQMEMQPPSPSVARSLRLAVGQPATTITIRFEDDLAGRPVALTVAVLRPDLFRIVVESRPPSALRALGADASPVAWTHGAEDWEP